MNRFLFRFSQVLVLVTSALGAASIVAQESTTKPVSAEPLEEVTVTGYRHSIEESLEQKRAANAFVDVINAEDVGKFPDKNVADSLQRVPGIIITRDGGEGSRVSIRGLEQDLTLTQLNGNYVASADSLDPARSFNYVPRMCRTSSCRWSSTWNVWSTSTPSRISRSISMRRWIWGGTWW
ncbi:MAG TPA: TonB-dependent receptor plug domain-containing protein [Steroidobacter sp.]